MNPDQLFHCSTPGCVALVKLNESVHFAKLHDAPPGRYCVPCSLTYERPLTQSQIDSRLATLLRQHKMLVGQTPPLKSH